MSECPINPTRFRVVEKVMRKMMSNWYSSSCQRKILIRFGIFVLGLMTVFHFAPSPTLVPDRCSKLYIVT